MARAVEWLVRAASTRGPTSSSPSRRRRSRKSPLRGVDRFASRVSRATPPNSSTVTRPQSDARRALPPFMQATSASRRTSTFWSMRPRSLQTTTSTIEIVGDGAQKDASATNACATKAWATCASRAAFAAARCDGQWSPPPTFRSFRCERASRRAFRRSFTTRSRLVVRSSSSPRAKHARRHARSAPSARRPAMQTRSRRTLRQLALLDKAALRAIGDAGKAALENRADRAGIMAGAGQRGSVVLELTRQRAFRNSAIIEKTSHAYLYVNRSIVIETPMIATSSPPSSTR